jgi:hypothetical protein
MASRVSFQENLQIAVASAIAILAIGLIIGTVLIHEINAARAEANPTPPITFPIINPQTNIGLPTKLYITDLTVQAAIEQVTIATDGSMAVPKDPMNAGWYATGTRPGAIGSAVIDGHVNWWGGKAGVFKNLHTIKPGTKIMVTDDTGAIISFIVIKTTKYDAAADATDIFTSTDGLAHLNLITCTGTWNTALHQYNDRLVVFADLIVE